MKNGEKWKPGTAPPYVFGTKRQGSRHQARPVPHHRPIHGKHQTGGSGGGGHLSGGGAIVDGLNPLSIQISQSLTKIHPVHQVHLSTGSPLVVTGWSPGGPPVGHCSFCGSRRRPFSDDVRQTDFALRRPRSEDSSPRSHHHHWIHTWPVGRVPGQSTTMRMGGPSPTEQKRRG